MSTASRDLVARLAAFRGRLRRALVVERSAQAIAFGFLAIVVAVVLDRTLRLPPAARFAELLALVAGGAAWAWFRVLPAVRFSPPLVEVALRLERGREDARGRLATGTDLAEGGDGALAGSPALVEQAVDGASRLAPGVLGERIDHAPMRKAVSAAAAAAVAFGCLAWLAPETSRIALLRLATPFADVQWPARTMVEPAFASMVHPRGAALALRAKAVRGEPQEMRVDAEYRVIRDGTGEWKDVTLSAQPDGTFERLVETDGDAIEVVFRTEDMETLPVTVRLVPPPAVRSAKATVRPPSYAAGAVDAREAELGNGTDRRATMSPPVLAGSDVELALEMDGTVAPPEVAEERSAWLARTVSVAGNEGESITPEFSVDADAPGRWTLRWRASGRGVVEVRPVGAEGIMPSERIAFEIPAIEDAAPVVAIVEPAADESVTPDAAPTVIAESRDDLSVKRLWLEASVVRAGQDPKVALTQDGNSGPAARVERVVSIAEIGAQAGDRVVCVARAVDAYERDGTGRAATESSPRVFRVIAPTELVEQVRSRLGQMRDAAARLREEQDGIADAMDDAARRTGESGEESTAQDRLQLAGTQSRMADRVASFERSLAELSARLERNKAQGDGLDESIDEARQLAQQASKAAQRAAEDAPKQGASQAAAESSRDAERALADLEASLDRDRATAEIARRIDRLAERIESARRDTQQAASQSVGKERSQLSPETKAQMERAAQAQREAASEARALSEDLARRAEEVDRERAEEGKERDPGASEAMREAQREADERGLARQLEQGARDTEENRMQAAQQSQQQAAEAVEAMQQAMRNQQKRRTEELERRVADAVDAIRGLLADIEERTLPMQRLGAEDPAAIDGEAKRMLALSRNAAGIAELAASAGNELRRAATLVARSAEQLDGAAVELRKQPAEIPPARESLDAARVSVQEALVAAQQAKRDAERAAENRRREELRGVYAQILERQRSARTGTQSIVPAPGKPLDRRAFIESRRVASEQQAVTGLLEAMAKREDIAGSELYSASNQEMVSASQSAAKDLQSSAPSRRTVMVQNEVEAGIAAMMEALSDPPEPDDPFAQAPGKPGQQQEGGGGGQGGGNERVPPMAELRLLRTMAQRVLDDTAAASELPEADRAAYLARVAARQKRILELGERWMKAMQEQQQANPEGVDAPRPEGGEKGAGG